MRRREFIKEAGLFFSGLLPLMRKVDFLPGNSEGGVLKELRFGIVADVHKDLVPDANQRLEKFISEAQRRDVEFIIQLGDFCMADPKNQDFLSIWRTFEGPRYHVLGNHDMDRNSKEEMLDYWAMPDTYYSFDLHGFHFVVLDANFLYLDGKYIDYERANFYVDAKDRTFIDEEQMEWFKNDLEETQLNTIIFSHQSLWHYQSGVKNRLALQKIMEAQKSKIICCMNGHDHQDFHHVQNGIHYLEINSMSYQWMDDKYRCIQRYPKELYDQYQWLPNLATYKDPLYAFATINVNGTLLVEGVRSEWVAPSPFEMGMPKRIYGDEISPEISDYEIEF